MGSIDKFKVAMSLRALGFALLCLLAATNGWAAVAFDAATSSDCASCTSLSWSHTTSSGSDRLLTVGVQISGNLVTLSGVTYNSISLSGTCSAANTNGDEYRAYISELVAPATGANTVAITPSRTAFDLIGGAVTWTGAHQTTPTGTCASATGNSSAPSVAPTVASDEIAIDSVIVATHDAMTAGSGQTERWDRTPFFVARGGGSTEAGPNPTMSWTVTSSNWAITAVGVKPAASASGCVPKLMLLGVGC